MKMKFKPFSTGTQTRQYAFNDTHMFAIVDGIEYKTEIDEDQHGYLFTVGVEDYIKQASFFDELAGDLIDRETDARAEAARLAARDAEYNDE